MGYSDGNGRNRTTKLDENRGEREEPRLTLILGGVHHPLTRKGKKGDSVTT